MIANFKQNLEQIRKRVTEEVERGAVTPNYEADPELALRLLNEALATELICVLRYQSHYYLASGIHAPAVAAEFKEHAEQEQEHVEWIAQRIRELNGIPDFNPHGLLERGHTEFHEAETLLDLILEDLVAERIAIESYREMIRYFGDKDPTSRRLFEKILAHEEEHAHDLADLITSLDPTEGPGQPHT